MRGSGRSPKQNEHNSIKTEALRPSGARKGGAKEKAQNQRAKPSKSQPPVQFVYHEKNSPLNRRCSLLSSEPDTEPVPEEPYKEVNKQAGAISASNTYEHPTFFSSQSCADAIREIRDRPAEEGGRLPRTFIRSRSSSCERIPRTVAASCTLLTQGDLEAPAVFVSPPQSSSISAAGPACSPRRAVSLHSLWAEAELEASSACVSPLPPRSATPSSAGLARSPRRALSSTALWSPAEFEAPSACVSPLLPQNFNTSSVGPARSASAILPIVTAVSGGSIPAAGGIASPRSRMLSIPRVSTQCAASSSTARPCNVRSYVPTSLLGGLATPPFPGKLSLAALARKTVLSPRRAACTPTPRRGYSPRRASSPGSLTSPDQRAGPDSGLAMQSPRPVNGISVFHQRQQATTILSPRQVHVASMSSQSQGAPTCRIAAVYRPLSEAEAKSPRRLDGSVDGSAALPDFAQSLSRWHSPSGHHWHSPRLRRSQSQLAVPSESEAEATSPRLPDASADRNGASTLIAEAAQEVTLRLSMSQRQLSAPSESASRERRSGSITRTSEAAGSLTQSPRLSDESVDSSTGMRGVQRPRLRDNLTQLAASSANETRERRAGSSTRTSALVAGDSGLQARHPTAIRRTSALTQVTPCTLQPTSSYPSSPWPVSERGFESMPNQTPLPLATALYSAPSGLPRSLAKFPPMATPDRGPEAESTKELYLWLSGASDGPGSCASLSPEQI